MGRNFAYRDNVRSHMISLSRREEGSRKQAVCEGASEHAERLLVYECGFDDSASRQLPASRTAGQPSDEVSQSIRNRAEIEELRR